MPDITKNSPPNPPKKGVGSGNNRPQKIKEITKITASFSVDPIVWDKAKKKLGRKLSRHIQDFLQILVKD
jgi:hypothetical protein